MNLLRRRVRSSEGIGRAAPKPRSFDRTPVWGLLLAGTALSVGFGFAVTGLFRFRQESQWVATTHEIIDRADVLLRHVVDVETAGRGFVISGAERYLDPMVAGEASIVRDLDRLKALIQDPGQRRSLDALEPLIVLRVARTKQLIAFRRREGFAATERWPLREETRVLMSRIREDTEAFVSGELRLLSDRTQLAERSARATLGAIAVLWGLSIGVLGVTGFRLHREAARNEALSRIEILNADLEGRARELAAEVAVRQSAEEEVRGRNADLKGFAYTVSHDLKAPLRGISGYAQELERRHRGGLGERALFCIAQIVTATRNLDALIDDLLKYARLDAEMPMIEEVRLQELVEEILGDRKHTLTEMGVRVDVQVQPQTMRVWRRGLQEVLTNLIDNAIKYSRESKPPKLLVKGECTEAECRFIVADNGIGFDMKHHDRIFGLFNRLVRATEFEGTGAGLAIVKKLVEKLGGTVRGESAPGMGATFIVDLPSRPDRTEAA